MIRAAAHGDSESFDVDLINVVASFLCNGRNRTSPLTGFSFRFSELQQQESVEDLQYLTKWTCLAGTIGVSIWNSANVSCTRPLQMLPSPPDMTSRVADWSTI